MYGSHRLLRTKFLPLFCSGVVRLTHRKCEVIARYHVQTAHEIFKSTLGISLRSMTDLLEQKHSL